MKNKILLFIAVLITFFSVSAKCQDAHIYYNLFNDSITYIKGGKQVKKLRIRKGQEVQLHLTEFNPFVNNIDFKMVETTDNTGSGLLGAGGMTSLMGGMLPGLGNIIPGGGEGLLGGGGIPLFDAPLLVLNDSVISIKNLFSGSRGSEQVDLANQTMKEINILINDAAAIHQQLMVYERAVQVSKLAIVNTDVLIHNTNLRPSLIKNMCQEYYDAVFQQSQQGTISINDLLSWQNLPAQYELSTARLKSKQGELGAKVALLEGLSKDLTSNPIDNEAYRQYTRTLIDTQLKARGVRDQLKDITTKAAVPSNLPSTQEMGQLQMKLAEVVSNDFTYNTTIKPTADQVSLDIKLLRNQVGGDTSGLLVKERNLKMEVRGGLKVNASAGISFGQFFEPSQRFSVNNGIIVAETEGTFTPSLTSFLHFYGYRGQKATVGGSLGIGFPLLVSGNSQSIQFFLGPSMILGSSQRIVLSTGLMGGQAQRLAKGYQVGDAFSTDLGDIPTQGKYEIGVFVGASFSLGK